MTMRVKIDDATADTALLGAAVRGRVVAHAMASARFTDKWNGLPAPERRLTGVRGLELADPAAESALESESRGALVTRGVPRPVCGFPIRGADGRTYWADMAWDDGRVIGECDGLVKYADTRALYDEKLRQEALENAGSHVVRWARTEVVRSPDGLAERVRRALIRPPR